jgi:hypothetical protein
MTGRGSVGRVLKNKGSRDECGMAVPVVLWILKLIMTNKKKKKGSELTSIDSEGSSSFKSTPLRKALSPTSDRIWMATSRIASLSLL